MPRGSHMTQRYGGKQGGFAEAIRAFAEQAEQALDATFREIVIEIGSSVITMSPVGNPEIWAQNAIAAKYNQAVEDHNSALRNDPANLSKNGRLKPGKKLKDGMDIVAPAGYVGGRFRGNWQFSIDSPATGELDRVDPKGNETIAQLEAQVAALTIGQTAYIVNNLIYAVPLEYGHSTQAPKGMVRVTLDRFQGIVDEAIRNNRV
ncbi:hypothetical protein CMV24_27870 [Pseudomonas plecoglossicida]|uniref:HK97 gp10 family phage protein n=2 Tax=Pseudomonas plecoglossicida TaxID=70775 RepID=A0A2A3LXF5_PSEDL|nr:hypothetical protein CMV24_27870 [Pseudomonas plecoglossicida]